MSPRAAAKILPRRIAIIGQIPFPNSGHCHPLANPCRGTKTGSLSAVEPSQQPSHIDAFVRR